VTAYMPLTIGTALSDEDLSKTSLIGAIERVLGVPIKLMEQVVDAVLAPRQIAELSSCSAFAAAPLRAHLLRRGRRARLSTRSPTNGPALPYRLVLSRAERRS